jgi:O-antigen/teichoic acid export membrane protein
MTEPLLPDDVSLVVRLRQQLGAAARSALARNAGKLGAAQGVILAVGLVQSVLVARWLGPKNFGVAALILSVPALIFTFFDPKAAEAVVKYLGEFMATGEKHKALVIPKLAYAVDAGLGLVGLVVVAICSPWAASHVLGNSDYGGLLVIAAAVQMVSAPADTSRAILSTFGRFSSIAWVQAGAAVFGLLIVLIVVGNGGGVRGLVLATCVESVLDAALVGWLAHRAIRHSLGKSWWNGRRADVAERLREFGGFLAYTDFSSLVSVFIKQADIVIVGWIAGPVQAGYYRLARSLTSPLTSGIVSLQAVLYPQVARLAAVDSGAIMHRVRRWFVWGGLPLAAVSLLPIPFVPQLIRLVAGADYLGATAATRWSLAGSAFVMACFWLRPIQLATGQVRFILVNSIVTGVLSVGGFVVVAGSFGAAGVAAVRAVIAGFGGTGAGLWWLWVLHRQGRLGGTAGGAERQVPAA